MLGAAAVPLLLLLICHRLGMWLLCFLLIRRYLAALRCALAWGRRHCCSNLASSNGVVGISQVGSIIGVGLADGAGAVRWKTVGTTAIGWVLTVPIAAGVSAVTYLLLWLAFSDSRFS